MIITIDGEPEKIAALVSELQRRQENQNTIINFSETTESLAKILANFPQSICDKE